MNDDFCVVTDPQRIEWMRDASIDPDRVPIKSIIPSRVNVPEKGEVLAFEMDIARLTNYQKVRLSEHLARRFNLSANEVLRDLDKFGCPVLVEHTTAVSTQPWKYID